MSDKRDIDPNDVPAAIRGGAGRKVIAVVGIDRYRNWRRLNNAVSDATGTHALFRALGFEEVTAPLYDERATRDAMLQLVTDDLRILGPDDSLVLFYAGHCSTRSHLGTKDIKTGYLIPVDAAGDLDRAVTWIDLDSWLRAASLLPAKHILVIIDACYSGIAINPAYKWRGEAGDSLATRRSRRVITAALDDELASDSGPVPGHSLFTGCLIEALTGGIVPNGRRFVTGSEIGLYVQQRVQSYPGANQTPDFGAFELNDRGEMLIPLAENTEGAPTVTAEPAAPTGPRPTASTGLEPPTEAPPISATPDREARDPRRDDPVSELSRRIPMSLPGWHVVALQNILVNAFRLDDLKDLLLGLGLQLENIVLLDGAIGMPGVTREIVSYFNRRLMIPELMQHIERARPRDPALRAFIEMLERDIDGGKRE